MTKNAKYNTKILDFFKFLFFAQKPTPYIVGYDNIRNIEKLEQMRFRSSFLLFDIHLDFIRLLLLFFRRRGGCCRHT